MSATENESLQRDIRRAFFRRIMIYIGVILAIAVIAVIAFRQFNTYSNARLKLREAKNIKISLEMVNTEYYALGLSIYDDTAEGNIRKGAYTHVEKLQGTIEGTVRLTGYDSKNRQITGLEYETEDYIVRYSRDGEEGKWVVCMIKELLTY
ncbi:MAG: hypothetical protein IKP88_02725 [Lachnospiraceae bacterium]|nr:hypothetical protein [Lachnospiraceae bacterium]